MFTSNTKNLSDNVSNTSTTTTSLAAVLTPASEIAAVAFFQMLRTDIYLTQEQSYW